MVVAPTPTGLTDPQREIIAEAVQQLRERRAERERAPVQAPPVQLPLGADNLFTWVIAAFGAAQPVSPQGSGCDVEISTTVSADPTVAQVGDAVDLSYTVANPGTVPLVDVQVASALPDGLAFVSATNNGAVDPGSGYVEWAVGSGLDAGASTTVSVAAVISGPGNLREQRVFRGPGRGRERSHGLREYGHLGRACQRLLQRQPRPSPPRRR